MKTSWTKGLDEQNSSDMRTFFKEGVKLRARLATMLTDMIEEKRNGSTLESHYENPNWAFLQAHRHGYERALRDIIDLIKE